jgi:hypothetical protein
VIVRVADSLGFEVPPAEALLARAEWRLSARYTLQDPPPDFATSTPAPA